MNPNRSRAIPALLALHLASCTSDPTFAFPNAIEGVPGVQQLGTITPLLPSRHPSQDDPSVMEDYFLETTLAANVIYGELGPTGTSELPGLTFEVLGTGTELCFWIDPELLFWNQSVSVGNPEPLYLEPDNIFDDGDLDVRAGQSVFYTGTPGVSIGTFEVRYTDPLGNTVPVNFVECISQIGRGSPEACTIPNSLPGVRYTVVLEGWSTPIDDDRLGYGLIVAASSCNNVAAGKGTNENLAQPIDLGVPPNLEIPRDECVIVGEAVQAGFEAGPVARTAGLTGPSWVGSEVPTWEGSVDFERVFCAEQTFDVDDGTRSSLLAQFCQEERQRVFDAGLQCSWAVPPGTEENTVRCYCGNPDDTPNGGAF